MNKNISRLLLAALLTVGLTACGESDDPDDPNGPDNTNTATQAEAPGQLQKSDIERDTNPDVDDETFKKLTADNRDFAFSLFDELRKAEDDSENLFVSPHSISIALAMTYAGARGNTKDEMSEALRFLLDDDELHAAFNKLDLELATRSEVETDDGEAFDLDIINQTWGHHESPFNDDFLDVLALNYGAGMRLVDFVNDFEETRLAINDWVEARTQDRIVDLLPEMSLTHHTRLVLVNAIYFYGSWNEQFSDSLTTDQPFALLDGSTAEIPMMRHSDLPTLGYFENDDTIAVSIPYTGNQVSMIAVMPAGEEDDFLTWEAQFDRHAFDDVAHGLETKMGELSFPKFEDKADFDLIPAFEELGMIDAFDQALADFTGLYAPDSGHNDPITGIFHQTFVAVDEEGTEAAAATAVIIGDESAPMPEFDVSFDRPFYYAIYDHDTETILFLGRMVDPS